MASKSFITGRSYYTITDVIEFFIIKDYLICHHLLAAPDIVYVPYIFQVRWLSEWNVYNSWHDCVHAWTEHCLSHHISGMFLCIHAINVILLDFAKAFDIYQDWIVLESAPVFYQFSFFSKITKCIVCSFTTSNTGRKE